MRLTVLSALMFSLAAVACTESSRTGLAPRGTPERLTYAEAGTQITLANLANGTASQTRIVAGDPTGLRGIYTTSDGVFGSFYPGCWDCGDGMTIEEEKYASLWPLQVGKRAVFLRTGPGGQKARMMITIAGRQAVETKAGNFQAFVLDGRLETIEGPRYSAQVRAWWAPRAGWVVKAEGGDSQGNTLSSEVVEFIQP